MTHRGFGRKEKEVITTGGHACISVAVHQVRASKRIMTKATIRNVHLTFCV